MSETTTVGKSKKGRIKDYRAFLRSLKQGKFTLDELTEHTPTPPGLLALKNAVGQERYKKWVVRAFDIGHLDQETGEVLWKESRNDQPKENGKTVIEVDVAVMREGTSSRSIQPPPAPPPAKTREQIEEAVFLAVWNHGSNILNLADRTEVLGMYGLTPEEVTEQMVARADRRVRQAENANFRANNADPARFFNVVKKVEDGGDEELDPELNPDHPVKGSAFYRKEVEDRQEAEKRGRLAGLRAKKNGKSQVNGDLDSGIMEGGNPSKNLSEGEDNMKKSKKTEATDDTPKTTEGDGAAKRKAPKREGPSNKELVYKAWKKSKEKAEPAELYKEVEGEVKELTVRSWISAWKRGQNLPACAKE